MDQMEFDGPEVTVRKINLDFPTTTKRMLCQLQAKMLSKSQCSSFWTSILTKRMKQSVGVAQK
jgi:hypothetical protein